jgi:hypothetical protein
MNYTFIILGIFLVIVLYVLYRMLMKPTSVISSKTYLQSIPPSVPLSTLTNANSMNYYYSLWIYVNNLNTPPPDINSKNITALPTSLKSKNKTILNNIFYVADNSNSNVFLSLDVGTDTALTTNLLLKQGNSTPALQEYQITPSFPLQRWEHVIISVNQSYLDLYLDGKLAKSINLIVNPEIPPVNINNPASIHFGNGDVYVAGFQRISNSMDPQTAWNMYLSGSGQNAYTNNYGLSMTLSHNNTPKSTFTFF